MILNDLEHKLDSHHCYTEQKSLFSPKEIIFRSNGRARVWQISPKFQIIMLVLVCLITTWSLYSYHFYSRSDSIIHRKDQQLDLARDAYLNLITDFLAIHKNVNSILDSSQGNSKDIEIYKKKASVFEDKIKQIADLQNWTAHDELHKKTEISDVLLQRDIVASERDSLKKQVDKMENILSEVKQAELEVFEKLRAISSKEVDKLRSTFNSINAPLKKHGLYFNPLANKKDSKGGLFIPESSLFKDKNIDDKVSQIYQDVENYEYYKEVLKHLPLGQPVWSYWVTSQYGTRNDPFKGSKASHKGVDLASRTGNKIKIKAEGKVVKAQYSNGYGNLVVVDHGNGFSTKYAHLNKIYVKKGQVLKYDDVIGEVGSTGRSTGPHLHYEVLYRGVSVNPLPFIKAKAS